MVDVTNRIECGIGGRVVAHDDWSNEQRTNNRIDGKPGAYRVRTNHTIPEVPAAMYKEIPPTQSEFSNIINRGPRG